MNPLEVHYVTSHCLVILCVFMLISHLISKCSGDTHFSNPLKIETFCGPEYGLDQCAVGI